MLRCLFRCMPALLVVGCATPPAEVPESGLISGVVVDQSSGNPLAGANLVTVPASSSTVTDGLGSFSLSIPSGDYQLVAQRLGYSSRCISIHVYEGTTSAASLAMLPLDSIEAGLNPSEDTASTSGSLPSDPTTSFGSWTLTHPPKGKSWSRYVIHRIRAIDDDHAWACGVLADVDGITPIWTRGGFVLRWDAALSQWNEETLPSGTGPVEDLVVLNSGVWAIALTQGTFGSQLLRKDASEWVVVHSEPTAPLERALASGSLAGNAQEIVWSRSDGSVFSFRSGSTSKENALAGGLVTIQGGLVYAAGGPSFNASLELIAKPLLRRNALGWTRIGTKNYRCIAKDLHERIWVDVYGGKSDTLEVYRNDLRIKTIVGVPFSGPFAPLDTNDFWVASKDSLYHYDGKAFTPDLAGHGTITALEFHRKASGWMASTGGIHAYR